MPIPYMSPTMTALYRRDYPRYSQIGELYAVIVALAAAYEAYMALSFMHAVLAFVLCIVVYPVPALLWPLFIWVWPIFPIMRSIMAWWGVSGADYWRSIVAHA
jgi:hypothetical protein